MKPWRLIPLMTFAFALAILPMAACDNTPGAPGPFVMGKPAPDFTLNDLNGKPVNLSALKGSVVMLSFWIPVQPGSLEQLPELAAAWEKLKVRGLAVISLSPQGSEGDARRAVAGKPYLWTFAADADGSVGRVYGVDTISAMPVSIFITASGKYDSMHSGGALNRRTIEEAFGFAQRR